MNSNFGHQIRPISECAPHFKSNDLHIERPTEIIDESEMKTDECSSHWLRRNSGSAKSDRSVESDISEMKNPSHMTSLKRNNINTNVANRSPLTSPRLRHSGSEQNTINESNERTSIHTDEQKDHSHSPSPHRSHHGLHKKRKKNNRHNTVGTQIESSESPNNQQSHHHHHLFGFLQHYKLLH